MNNGNMVKERHIGRAIGGFFLTYFMMGAIFVAGILIALKSSWLRGDTINEVIQNTKIYDAIGDVVIDTIYEEMDGQVSKDALREMLPNSEIQNAIDDIIDAIHKDKNMDFSYLKGKCSSAAKDFTSVAVDALVDEMEKQSVTFDASVLKNNEDIQQLNEDLGIDVAELVGVMLVSEYGSTEVSTSDLDMEKIKNAVEVDLGMIIYEIVDDSFDIYIEEINDTVNECIHDINDDYKVDKAIDVFNSGLSILNVIVILIYIFAAVLFAVQILIYRKELYRAFRNLAISMFLVAIPVFIMGVGLMIAENVIKDESRNHDSAEQVLMELVQNNIASFREKLMVIGVVYIVIMVVAIVLNIVIKNKKRKAIDNGYGYNVNGYNTNSYNTNGYDANSYNGNSYNANNYNTNDYNANSYDVNNYNGNSYDANNYNTNSHNAEDYTVNYNYGDYSGGSTDNNESNPQGSTYDGYNTSENNSNSTNL